LRELCHWYDVLQRNFLFLFELPHKLPEDIEAGDIYWTNTTYSLYNATYENSLFKRQILWCNLRQSPRLQIGRHIALSESAAL
jgi:hypothetical protein